MKKTDSHHHTQTSSNLHHQDFLHFEAALQDFKSGKPLILVDDEDRENEGDLVIAASCITPEWINFMATQGKGLICTPIDVPTAQRLNLHPMTAINTSEHETAFTVSVDAAQGISTGISAQDRALTIKLLNNPATTAAQLVRPGHIFPLIAKAGGVLIRPGHTEAALDLCQLANFPPCAVICEIMNSDGSMARLADLRNLASLWDLKLLSIKTLIDYRWKNENLLELTSQTQLPTEFGNFEVFHFKNIYTKEEVVALLSPQAPTQNPLIRIHSSCITGETFHSLRCDCGFQLQETMKKLACEFGVLVYLFQEGRGIGLENKLKSYALQDQGHDTIVANEKLGFVADQRHYNNAYQVLKYFNFTQGQLLTNNPLKGNRLIELGLNLTLQTIQSPAQKYNYKYLQTKIDKMQHSPELLKKDSTSW